MESTKFCKQTVSYESIGGIEQVALKLSDDKYINYESSRKNLIEAGHCEQPESEDTVKEYGRYWVPKTGILPSTQAAVHVQNCDFCNGIPSKCYPEGQIFRYYPSDGVIYKNYLDIVKQLHVASEMEPLKNEIDPLTGTTYDDNDLLRDTKNRYLK